MRYNDYISCYTTSCYSYPTQNYQVQWVSTCDALLYWLLPYKVYSVVHMLLLKLLYIVATEWCNNYYCIAAIDKAAFLVDELDEICELSF